MLVLNRRSIMANKTIDMSRIRQIIRLYTQGTSKKKISVLTASSRNTVTKYISKFIQDRLTYESIEAMSDYALDLLFSVEPPPHKDERYEELQLLLPGIEKQMKRKGMNITLQWEQYLYTLDKAFSENEKGQSGNIPALSSQVDLAGRNSNHFFPDLNRFQVLKCIIEGRVYLPGKFCS